MRRTNEIRLQKEKVEEAYEIIEQKNNYIEGGIRYAQNIQNAILPQDALITSLFDYSLIFLPKDVVSGDFYWMLKKQIADNQLFVFIATVDCTGHGVPGAFMSLIGYSLLNEIVNEKQIYSPAKILDELNVGIRIALNQETTANNDGMDISLCRIDIGSTDSYPLHYAGAKRNAYLYHQEQNQLEILNADRIMIGGARASNINTKFTEKTTQIKNGDNIYLMTDGIIDQNAPDRKRLGSDAVIEHIALYAKLPILTQKEKLLSFFDAFREGEMQRDDITFWALQLKKERFY